MRAWLLADDRPGNVTQSLGLLEALGIPYETKYLDFSSTPFGGRFDCSGLQPPWPGLHIVVAPFYAYLPQRDNLIETLLPAASWVLAMGAGLLFYGGYFGLGLLLGWIMTFLDTVDGKLARVTVDSSEFGHLFDHVLDVVHPPLWYLAWGMGLSSYDPLILKLPVLETFWVLFAAYVGGRVIARIIHKKGRTSFNPLI